MRRLFVPAALSFAGAACWSPSSLELPRSDARSGILVIQPPGKPTYAVYAFEVDAIPPLAIPAGAQLWVAMYAEDLPALDILPGPVPTLGPSDVGRRFPRDPLLAATTTLEGARAWREVAAADLPNVTIPLFDAARCAEAGGCLTERDDRCILPCPMPEPPKEPSLPDMACPAGWSGEDLGDRIVACRPTVPPPADCLRPMVQWYAESGCARIGPPCPAGDFAEDADQLGRTVIYAKAGAAGGTGSRAAPFGTIEEAVAHATGGEVIALSGAFAEPAVVSKPGVSLLGACVETTSVPGVNIQRDDVSISRLEVTGAAVAIIVAARRTALRDLSIRGGRSEAVYVSASAGVEVEGTLIEGAGGSSLVAVCGARVDIVRSILSGHANGVAAVGASRGCTHEGSLGLKDTSIESSTVAGLGIVTSSYAVSLERVLVRNRTGSGIRLTSATTAAVLEDVSVIGVADGPADRGLVNGIDIRRVPIDGARIAVDDVPGCGVSLVEVSGEPASIDHLTVSRARTSTTTASPASGICIGGDLDAKIDHAALVDNRRFALFLGDGTRTATISNMVARTPMVPGHDIVAIRTGVGSKLVLDKARIRGFLDQIIVDPDCELRADDLAILGTAGIFFRSAESSRTRLARVLVDGASGTALRLGSELIGSVVDLTVRNMPCQDDVALELPRTGFVSVSRFALTDNRGIGVFVAPTATLAPAPPSVTIGEVARNRVGIAVGAAGYDLGQAIVRVRYHDNETNVGPH
jgi:hypothetical protein